ncbi:MAG TPA: thioredoxin family protein [Polyangium sp.]|nr:thioredoxin family protein [Polyangium sp.]
MTKKASLRKARSGKPKRGNPSGGSWASLAAAGGSILALLGLIYASCKDSPPEPHADPVVAQVQAPAAPPPTVATTVAAAPTPPPAAPKQQKEDWNETGIAWQTYEAGMAKAKKENKPVCLVFFTNWCPHCRNYSKVFSDPRVVTRSKDFIMIRLNADEVPDISTAHSPDGTYVPRTFFLSSEGKILPDVHAPRPQYLYFYDEANPESLLGGMDAALKKIRAM